MASKDQADEGARAARKGAMRKMLHVMTELEIRCALERERAPTAVTYVLSAPCGLWLVRSGQGWRTL